MVTLHRGTQFSPSQPSVTGASCVTEDAQSVLEASPVTGHMFGQSQQTEHSGMANIERASLLAVPARVDICQISMPTLPNHPTHA